jgi:hypothetical protein
MDLFDSGHSPREVLGPRGERTIYLRGKMPQGTRQRPGRRQHRRQPLTLRAKTVFGGSAGTAVCIADGLWWVPLMLGILLAGAVCGIRKLAQHPAVASKTARPAAMPALSELASMPAHEREALLRPPAELPVPEPQGEPVPAGGPAPWPAGKAPEPAPEPAGTPPAPWPQRTTVADAGHVEPLPSFAQAVPEALPAADLVRATQ